MQLSQFEIDDDGIASTAAAAASALLEVNWYLSKVAISDKCQSVKFVDISRSNEMETRSYGIVAWNLFEVTFDMIPYRSIDINSEMTNIDSGGFGELPIFIDIYGTCFPSIFGQYVRPAEEKKKKSLFFRCLPVPRCT